jgi:myo-inositol-1(or 4)-monophosphatase
MAASAEMDLDRLQRLVVEAAREELVPRFAHASARRKADNSIVTEADFAMQRRLTAALREQWPGIPLLGEEMEAAEQEQLLAASDAGLWCLDPLDGTSNFAAGLPFYAVSLALLRDGEVDLGIIYDPAREECFTARRGEGAWLNGARLGNRRPEPPLSRGIALVDFKRLPTALAARMATEPPYRSQRSFGSVALEWCWLAAGRAHVYLHGKQKLWDYAAASLILAEAGGRAVTLEGETVFRSALAARSTAAALEPRLFDEWARWLEIPLAG